MHTQNPKPLRTLNLNDYHFVFTRLEGKKSNKNQWSKSSHQRPKGSPKDMQPTGTKERRELVPLMVGSYLNLQEPKNN
jgi:hypothetical protein